MAWTAPRTWNVGELVTKAIMDVFVRDNQLYLKQRELWVPVTYGSNGIGTSLLGSQWGASLTGAADVGGMEFRCPFDFLAIITAKIVVMPRVTDAAANWDIRAYYGAEGEQGDTHDESDNATTYNVTQNELYGVDASGILTALAAGDVVALHLTLSDAADDVHVVGFYLIYN